MIPEYTWKRVAHSYRGATAFELGPFDLRIKPGLLTCWLGPNGSGKSTLAHYLTGAIGDCRSETPVFYFNQRPQENIYSDLTVGEHFRMFSADDWMEACRLFPDIAAWEDKYPDQLSGGMLQLVAFRLAITRSASVLIFDELTNHLSPDSVEKVLASIRKLLKERPATACILITHDIPLAAAQADEVQFFREGGIVEEWDESRLGRRRNDSRSDLVREMLDRANATSYATVAPKLYRDVPAADAAPITSDYFAERAPRYKAALEACPESRLLDFLPYVSALELANFTAKKPFRILDAFGGNGFLSRGFEWSGLKFTVADACEQMFPDPSRRSNVEFIRSDGRFLNVAGRFGVGSFDAIFCHGGLHHVVAPDIHNRHAGLSRATQENIILRLAGLLDPGGIILIADVPETIPHEKPGPLASAAVPADFLAMLLGENPARLIRETLSLDPGEHTFTVADCQSRIDRLLHRPHHEPVPRHFFDHFVSPESNFGHFAIYPDFDELDRALVAGGFECQGRMNYRGPWLFRSPEEAGWFFGEKFSIGPAPVPYTDHADARSRAMFETLRKYLGAARLAPNRTSVNWGVTYACYRKPR